MHRQPQFKSYAALSAVCIFWGTTYLAIRMGLETFPPLMLVCFRFLSSGTLLLATAKLSGARLPKGRELLISAVTGIVCLGVGNGCLTFAEVWIPSGLAALIITISPFWLVGIEAMLPGGERLHAPTIGGMVVGCIGAALLVAPDALGQSLGGTVLKGFLILQLGNASWSWGSIYQRRQASEAHPIVTGAVQQLAAGLAFVPLVLIFPGHPIHWSFRGVGALVYLILFGSIVGYSAYIYSMSRLPVAVVSIYPYVNTIVAVFLGWLFYRERFGLLEAGSMAIIFTGVGLVKKYGAGPRPPTVAPAAGRR